MLHNRQAPGQDFHKQFSLAPARSDTNPPSNPQSAPSQSPTRQGSRSSSSSSHARLMMSYRNNLKQTDVA